jgi:hypothetical protein
MIYRQQKTPILVKGIQLHWGREHANGTAFYLHFGTSRFSIF